MVTEVMAPVAVPVEPTTPIKPSEALRLGAMVTRQITGQYNDGRGGACAIGATGDERDVMSARIRAARAVEVAVQLALYREELPSTLRKPTVLRAAGRQLAPVSESEQRVMDGNR